MQDEHTAKRTIPNVLKAINETNDILETTNYENQLACMFASPMMFLGAAVNFVLRYLILHKDLCNTLINSLTFFALGILLEVVLRLRLKIELATYIISILYSSVFIFLLIRLYDIVGPAVWMIACIQIVFAMIRIKRDMAIIIGINTVLASIYALYYAPNFQFHPNYFYFIAQSIVMVVFIIVLSIVHRISTDRYFKLRSQLQVVEEQKHDITELYEEIAATEEELRAQNEQLMAYADEVRSRDEKLYDLAYYDNLTKLPNRKMLMERLDLLIKKSKQQKSVFYVVFIDMDSFKKINDTMGHHIGDRFINFAADNLKTSTHEGDLLGRMGGDEFALIINRNLNREEVFQEIETIRNCFTRPLRIENAEIRSTASFGISVFPDDGDNAPELLKCADMSMYKAKELGKNNVQFFKKYMKDEIVQKLEMEERLINALNNQEFSLVFQPQYNLANNNIRGFEALARWNSPEFGILKPMQFIPLAEEIGLIIPLGEWILKTACLKFKKLQEQYGLKAFISVNISTVQIKDSNFIKVVKSILSETGLDPKYLELEITESVFIESFHQTVPILNELKKLGLRMALDDFGTGYSSLSYLKLLPIDTLKIDKSFVDDLSVDNVQVQILGDIISLGHNLGVAVIAEGVEYPHQLEYLKNHSCDYAQGFLMQKPLEEDDLRMFLQLEGTDRKCNFQLP